MTRRFSFLAAVDGICDRPQAAEFSHRPRVIRDLIVDEFASDGDTIVYRHGWRLETEDEIAARLAASKREHS